MIPLFLRETRTFAQLKHPHIVNITDCDIQQGGPFHLQPFLVMDYITNGSLRKKYPRGTRLPLTTIIKYTAQIADILYGVGSGDAIGR